MSTITGRKTRADAKLEQLDAAQRELLHFWFEEEFSYYEVVKRVQEHFGLSVGRSTVSAYWRRHILPQRQQGDAETVAELAALPAGDFNAAMLQLAWRLAWDALARSHPDIDRATKLFAIVYKAEAHALALKRLALEERRVAVREKLAAAKLQETPTPVEGRSVAPREANSPRCAGYSGPVRSSGEVRESAEMGEWDEGAEIAAKAQRSEDRSKGSEEAMPRAGESLGGAVSKGELGALVPRTVAAPSQLPTTVRAGPSGPSATAEIAKVRGFPG